MVLDQVRAAAETLATLGTLVGLLARVSPLVYDKVRGVAEALPTGPAPVGLLARVCS